ncbi:MAG: cardiolipin synthase [Prevotella sp.]|nr:cardiolipin synthase [Prevotella sp.]
MEGLFYIIGMTLLWGVIALTVIHVVMDNRQPAKTMAWALVILFLPLVGIVLYIFFGINHRRERLVSQRSLDQLSKRSMLGFVEQQDLHVADSHKQLVDLFINQNLSLPFKVAAIDIMTDGYSFFPELLADIGQARHHIHISMYIFEEDALGNLVADALIDKSRQGVKVRVIYDDVGCWRVPHRFFERMREGGVEVQPFLPVHFPTFTSKVNYRNHRKIIVVDGRVGYIGGMNIALRYVKGTGEQPWRDTMLRLQGPIVYSLQRSFLVDWYFVDRTLITNRDYYPTDIQQSPLNNSHSTPVAQVVTSSVTARYPEIMQGFVRAITAARRYIYLETPYFIPNEPVLFALKTATMAGVDVRILCPYHSDARFTEWASRSYLRELHEAGAKVFLYKAGFMHSKLMVIDDALVTCGSTNADFRSFENNFEANVFIYDQGTALRLKKVFLDDQSLSVTLESVSSWMHPTFFPRLWESLTRMISPLL